MGQVIKITELKVGDIFFFGTGEGQNYKCIYLGTNCYWAYGECDYVYQFEGMYNEVTVVGKMKFIEETAPKINIVYSPEWLLGGH